jgi:exopolysaccharide production protein ExoY
MPLSALPRPTRADAGYSVTAPAAGTAVGGATKRALDAVGALSVLFMLSPLLLTVALLIWLADGGPVFFRHRRIGRNGIPFDCFKFRTMVVDADRVLRSHLAANPLASIEWERTRKLRSDPRITPLGLILRKASIDELPQLFNVLKGEMSFVGPRPIVGEEIPKYGPCIDDYFRARPGITGKWQVSGRNDLRYEDRVELDRQYVADWSLWADLRIIARTLVIVVTARGCY